MVVGALAQDPETQPDMLEQALETLQRVEREQQSLQERITRLQAARMPSDTSPDMQQIILELTRMEGEQAIIRSVLEAMLAQHGETASVVAEEPSEKPVEEILPDDTEKVAQEPSEEAVAPGTSAGLDPAIRLYERGRDEFRNLKFYDAAKSFRDFLQRYPKHPDAIEARYWLGETLYVEGKFEEAIEAFADVVRDESSPHRFAALLKTGFSWFDLGDYDRAEVALVEVRDRKPDGRLATLATLRLKRLYQLRPKSADE